ncbi:MAG: error-prone polymerase [Blastocatellia bacterium]|nr:error-prone polymerase [Blastocatellia bacterium]
MSAMALLDRDGLYGAPRFHLAAVKKDVKAHIGAEITVQSPKSKVQSQTSEGLKADVGRGTLDVGSTWDAGQKNETFSLPLLVRNRKGYQNLSRLITLMKLRVPKHAKPGECAVTPDELAAHAAGLVCLTGVDDGPLAKFIREGDSEKTMRTGEWLVDVFGKGNVYAELQRHFNREEEARNQAVVAVARSLRLPLLATNGICYATRAQRQVADVFTCIRNHVRLETAGRLLAKNSEAFLKPAKEMVQLFSDLPEAIAGTLDLSSRLEFTLKDLGYEFPKYSVPPGQTMASFLRQRTDEGARLRYTGKGTPTYERARQQIERELTLIEKLHLEGYFLIVWDIVEFCRREGILIQGRGSAANSAVCYSLGITAVDPVGMELLFERFLSEERGEWPDIDLDLPSGDQRERAIQYVYQRYGKLGAAMTANVITYRGRSAAREVGKVLGFDEDTVGRLSSLVHTWEWKDPKDSTARQFRDAGLDLTNPRIKKFFQLYQMVQDLPRHLGQHSGGLVICQGQLDSVVPLEPAAMPGRVVVQWDKEDCADLGIVKVDLLGLGMMAVLEDSIDFIRDAYEEEVDLAHLPQDDPAVYAALQRADTIGMFQVESRAQMSCLPRLRPQTFYDIVVQVAIIRPGPIVGNMVHPYLKRRQGREPVSYAHPLLEPALKRTLGVPLFQEQLLKMAMICANFSGGEAEELRRAFGFKRSEARMKEIEVKLRAGMRRNGITPKAQEEIVQSITSFALYGFPESHAASFALIAYASAYLKCHYLAAFTAATLNNQPMGFYQPFTIIKDAQRHGLRTKPIDVMRSDWLCTIEKPGIGYEVSGVGGQVSGVGGQVSGAGGQVSGVRCQVPGFAYISTSDTRHLAPDTRHLAPDTRHPAPDTRHLAPDTRHPTPDTCLPAPDTRHPAPDPRHLSMRLGLKYVKGLSAASGQAIERERKRRPFTSIEDLHQRVPELRKDEMRKLAAVGALNFIHAAKSPTSKVQSPTPEAGPMAKAQSPRLNEKTLARGHGTLDKGVTRRDALWQIERVVRPPGPLYEELHETGTSPLAPMTLPERLNADFRGTGLTIGRHPVAHHRAELDKKRCVRAIDLPAMRNGYKVRVAGWVIVRQRPGTAKGFVFLTLEDETGVANVIVTPNLFDKNRLVLVDEPFLMIEGILQHQDNVISVKARKVEALSFTVAAAASHDFH